MTEETQKPDEGGKPSSNPSNPKPEVVDIGPRIIQHGEKPMDIIEIQQDIEKKKG